MINNNKKKSCKFLDNFRWSVLVQKHLDRKILSYNYKLINMMNKPRAGSIFYPNDNGFVVQLKDVSKWYLKGNKLFQVLKNINLEIQHGDYVVILGSSGSGKTSLLNLISGLEKASNGQVIVNHHNLITMTEKQLTKFRKKYVGFVFQSYLLLSNLTVTENIELGFELNSHFKENINVKQIIKKLGLIDHLNKYPKQLSGGQQQRVSIVRALAKQPKILFADEPTGAVDEKTAIQILKIFSEINQLNNTTIIMVTHNQIIAKLATKVIFIKSGQIDKVVCQTPENIENFMFENN